MDTKVSPGECRSEELYLLSLKYIGMVYNYLLDLYEALDLRKREIESDLSASFDSPEVSGYHQGRLTIINEFREFLKSSYHAKLPRRMQKDAP